MLAFHNDPKVKEVYVSRVTAHALADEIVKGQYWEDGKGCAIGCTIHGDDHLAYERELGIPVEIARLEDYLFEHLPNGKSKEWPLRFLTAIRVGADLSDVPRKFKLWLMECRLSRLPESDEWGVRKAVEEVARLLREGESDEEWIRAQGAARAAARAARAAEAAEAAARAAEAEAAARAAEAAAGAAAWAEAAARAAWAEAAARAAEVSLQANKLIELLEAA